MPTTKCIIKTNLSDKEKQTIRLTSNLIRNNDYLPSELAYAYKELAELEDMKTISEETNLSKNKIYRYIRLTYLIEPFLNRVDNGTIPVIAAVELSYLSREEQSKLFSFMLNHTDCRINTANARQIKDNPDDLEAIFYGRTSDSELYKELADKALETYRQHQDFQNVDNLSINDQKQEPDIPVEPNGAYSPVISLSASKIQSEHLYQDANGNVLPIEDIDLKDLIIICEAVIEKTHVDHYIFRYAYDSREILTEWNDKYICISDSSCSRVKGKVVVMDWNAFEHMFRIVVNGKDYIMLHKTLEQVVRKYIRQQYTVKRIKSVIEEECK